MTTKKNYPNPGGLYALLLGFLASLVLFAAPSVFAQVDPSSDPRLGGNRWGSQYFPNVELKTHTGETVRFFDDLIKDKVRGDQLHLHRVPGCLPTGDGTADRGI